MEGKLSLPANWGELSALEKTMWFVDNFGTDEDDEDGYLMYNVEAMAEDVLEEFIKTIRKSSDGFIMD